MIKYYKIITSFLLLVIFYSGSLTAADNGRASVYKVTMEELPFVKTLHAIYKSL